MTTKVRLRFAPSPTGFVHLGSLRTALFGYLLAKNLQGDFILRIEDTDQSRLVPGSLENLLEVMDWAGIKFSEGPHLGGDYGPYIQTERLEIYQKYCQQLLDQGTTYRCFCSSERLEQMRQEQTSNKQAPRYDRLCRELTPKEVEKKLTAGQKFVVRQAMPTEGIITVVDELRGEIKFPAKDLEDQVLMKSDGIPTYQLANIVDDHLMEITHVTRGEEWIPSLPKNILLYQAFGWSIPKFIHLPLILNQQGGKLSKRQGDVFVENYRHQGYLPEALVNFCALLGWHPKNDQEIFSLSELEKEFSLAGLGISPAIFDPEKLLYFNNFYLRQKSPAEILTLAKPLLQEANLITDQKKVDNKQLERAITIAQERLRTLNDLSTDFAFLFSEINYDAALLLWKDLTANQVKANLQELLSVLNNISDWQITVLEEEVISYLQANNKKNGDYLWPLRVALSGAKFSPSPFELAWALGKEKSLARIKQAITNI